jgi:hypothetical protein
MKITVQNGTIHCLSRKDAEALLPMLPQSWHKQVSSIVLYGGNELAKATFYPQTRTLGLFGPSNRTDLPAKTEAITELLIALSIVSERGELPTKPTKTLIKAHLLAIAPILEQCLRAVQQHIEPMGKEA